MIKKNKSLKNRIHCNLKIQSITRKEHNKTHLPHQAADFQKRKKKAKNQQITKNNTNVKCHSIKQTLTNGT